MVSFQAISHVSPDQKSNNVRETATVSVIKGWQWHSPECWTLPQIDTADCPKRFYHFLLKFPTNRSHTH